MANFSSDASGFANARGGRASEGAWVLFTKAGLTEAALRELKTTAHERAIANILTTDKLSKPAARELSEVLKRTDPPFSLESLQLLDKIVQFNITGGNLEQEVHAVNLIVHLIHKTYRKELSGHEKSLDANSRIVAGLDKSALTNLLACISHGPETARISYKVLDAVAKTSPGREAEALSILKTHAGLWRLLDKALTVVGNTYDIFSAARNTQVLFLTKALREQYGYDEFKETVALDSGVVSKSEEIYAFMNAGDPERIMFLGDTAAPHLAETLFAGKYKGNRREAKKAVQVRTAKAEFENVTIEDLLADPGLEKEIGSPLVGRALQVYKDLVEEQQRLRREITSELKIAAPEEVLTFLASMQLRCDDPTTLLNRVKRSMNEKPDTVPEIVRMAYQNLSDKNSISELSAESFNPAHQDQLERACWRTVALWASHHEFIKTPVALRPHLEDLKEFEKLPQGDLLREKYGNFHELSQILSAIKQPVMSHSDFGKLLLQYDLLGFRREMNERLWQQYGETIQKAADKFRPLFKDKTRWREDCIPLRVPQRVHSSLWGARIVHTPGHFEEIRPAVSDKEFRALLRLELLLSSFPSGENRTPLFRVTSVDDFRKLMRLGAYAYRKAEALESRLKDFSFENPFDVSSELAKLNKEKPSLVTHSIEAKEKTVGLEEDINPPLSISLGELARRLDDARGRLPATSGITIDRRSRIVSFARSGLYLKDDLPLLQRIAPALQELIHKNDPSIRVSLKHAKKIVDSALVTAVDFPKSRLGPNKPELNWKYYTAAERDAIQALAREITHFRSAQLHRKKNIDSLEKRFDLRIRESFYTGILIENVLSATLLTTENLFGSPLRSPGGTFTYRDPKELAERLDKLDQAVDPNSAVKEYTQAANLPGTWYSKARLACSITGAAAGGYRLDPSARDIMKGLGPKSNAYFSDEFVETIKHLEAVAKVSQTLKMVGTVGVQQRFRWEDKTLLINFTKTKKGENVLQTAIQNQSFLEGWMQGQEFIDKEAKDIALQSVILAKRQFQGRAYLDIRKEEKTHYYEALAQYIASLQEN
jgi:hypothetical protein